MPGAIKIASNETVHGPLPSVHGRHRPPPPRPSTGIPTTATGDLRERLAKHVDVAPENISVGSGSVSLCQQLIQITSTVGDEVMFGWRSFEIYPLQVRTAGATPVAVPLKDHVHDLDAMLAAVTDRTRLIFVCNPNNPTSTVVEPGRSGGVRRGGALGHPHRHRRGLCRIHPRRPAARQSRAWSAGTRTSLCCVPSRRPTGWPGCASATRSADPDIITALGKVYVPFTATTISQAAAIASIDAADELLARTDAVVAERARVSAALSARRIRAARLAGQFRLATDARALRRRSPTPRPTTGCWCGPTGRTASASRSPPHTRTTRFWRSPDSGSEENSHDAHRGGRKRRPDRARPADRVRAQHRRHGRDDHRTGSAAELGADHGRPRHPRTAADSRPPGDHHPQLPDAGPGVRRPRCRRHRRMR